MPTRAKRRAMVSELRDNPVCGKVGTEVKARVGVGVFVTLTMTTSVGVGEAMLVGAGVDVGGL